MLIPIATGNLRGAGGALRENRIDAFVDRTRAIGEAWLEIEPVTPGLRYWAFVTVTNNATSHVTTITPQ